MTVRITEAERPERPITVEVVITDPAWMARRDQALRAIERQTLWTYGGPSQVAATATRQGERP